MQEVGFVLVRGGGDLGTGVAHALAGAGWRVLVVDLPRPTALRLSVAFAAAALRGWAEVEGRVALRCGERREVEAAWRAGAIPLWVAPEARLGLRPLALVDARMRGLRGAYPPTRRGEAAWVVGIGPGFTAGDDCDVVIESNRGPRLGAVIATGSAEPHTGRPGLVQGHRDERLLRAPCAGTFVRRLDLGDFVEPGDAVGSVRGRPVRARLAGMIRGLKLTGTAVGAGHKVGDVDPRRDPALLLRMTDKARAVGRGVVRALEQAGIARRTACI
ncbi:MAG: EF2563 family selenium-dependent molybdenum hydroxylase system protein [Planctomycetota bacterium]|nr:MAG: EF2563 family selenium-dependent molybdenum hydroxylase system protein [Planctomycetota bacterium]